MFGNPLKITLILLLCFGGGCGFALSWLFKSAQSEASPSVPISSAEEAEKDITAWVTIRSAHPFRSLSLSLGEQEIQMDSFSESESEAEVFISRTPSFLIDAQWNIDAPETALLFRLEADGYPTEEKTIWAKGKLKQELSFKLKGGNHE